jgi:hypothetical protein
MRKEIISYIINKIPNPKSQFPNKFQYQNPKFKTDTVNGKGFEFKYLDLVLVWSL